MPRVFCGGVGRAGALGSSLGFLLSIASFLRFVSFYGALSDDVFSFSAAL